MFLAVRLVNQRYRSNRHNFLRRIRPIRAQHVIYDTYRNPAKRYVTSQLAKLTCELQSSEIGESKIPFESFELSASNYTDYCPAGHLCLLSYPARRTSDVTHVQNRMRCFLQCD